MLELDSDSVCVQIVEQAADAVVVAGPDGTICLWNSGAEDVFGFSKTEAIGQSLDLIIPERQRSRHWEGFHRVMETGMSRYGRGEMLTVPGLRKDGSRLSLEFTIVLLSDADGRPAAIAAILRDVTARFQRDRELQRRLADLEAGLTPPKGFERRQGES